MRIIKLFPHPFTQLGGIWGVVCDMPSNERGGGKLLVKKSNKIVTHFVCCGGIRSSAVPLICGVPQGSVLGAVLFILYVADLAALVESWSDPTPIRR